MPVSKSTYAVDRDEDLKSYLDAEVSCVEFSVKHGKPGLSLDLNCGKSVWTPVSVKKPTGSFDDGSEVLSVAELADMDEVVFRCHETDDSPGLMLRKGSLEVWTPIAARTRSRLKRSDASTVLDTV